MTSIVMFLTMLIMMPIFMVMYNIINEIGYYIVSFFFNIFVWLKENSAIGEKNKTWGGIYPWEKGLN